MPKKVMTLQGIADVPTWQELFQQIGYINDNKQAIWDILDQLKDNPPHGTNTDYQREVRRIYESIRDLERNVWRKDPGEDRWTLWDSIHELERNIWRKEEGEDRSTLWDHIGKEEERLEALEQRMDAIPATTTDALRSAMDELLRPLFQSSLGNALAKLDSLEEENRRLHSDLESLREEVQSIRGTMNQ